MSYRIVVVDDNIISLRNVKTLLDEQGMQVVCLRSGKDLLKFLEHNTADVVLLDIMMPEMDGFETYSAMRALEDQNKRSPIPVIFLTGESNSDVERRGLSEGASDFIRKPINREVLIKRITNTVESNKKIELLTVEANTDKLTGFLNKVAGIRQISELCTKQDGTLVLLDLDNFKLVNDLFGHDMGDRILVAFSNIIRRCVRAGDVVSRIGGDEFMAFLPDFAGDAALASLSRRLNQRLGEVATELMGKEHGIPLGISIGASNVPEHGKDYTRLFQYADMALYKVKNNGKHGYMTYEAEAYTLGNEDLEKELLRILQILSERRERRGALMLGKDAFTWNFRFINRFIERYDTVATKVLISLSATEREIPMAEDVDKFVAILKRNLRCSDIIFQSRPNQFFIVLPLLTEDDSQKVMARIRALWEEQPCSKRTKLNYVMSMMKHSETKGDYE